MKHKFPTTIDASFLNHTALDDELVRRYNLHAALVDAAENAINVLRLAVSQGRFSQKSSDTWDSADQVESVIDALEQAVSS